MNQRQIERSAKDAHKRGETWSDFWLSHGDEVRQIEPIDRNRFHRLRQRLLGLVVAGDLDGAEPPSVVCPWEMDAGEQPHDTQTTARLQLPLWPLETATR